MGGTVQANGSRQPTFLTWTMAGPNTAQLQRAQIIKGWLESGEHQEQVYDVACSYGLTVDPQTHRCPDNDAQVNLEDCSRTANVGAGDLKALRTPTSRQDKRFFTTCAYWKIRSAGGPPGTPFEQAKPATMRLTSHDSRTRMVVTYLV
jgi:hypothetical protein